MCWLKQGKRKACEVAFARTSQADEKISEAYRHCVKYRDSRRNGKKNRRRGRYARQEPEQSYEERSSSN